MGNLDLHRHRELREELLHRSRAAVGLLVDDRGAVRRQDRPPDVRQGAAGQHVLGQEHPGEVVTNTNLGTEAAAAVNWLHITDTNDANVVIAAQQGTCFAASGGVTFAGNCGTPQASGYCAFHDWDVNTANSSLHLPWENLPYQPDAGVGCGQSFINTPGT